MGEAKRLFGQKKYILYTIALFVANVFLFQYFQMDTLQILDQPETKKVLLEEWKENREASQQDFYERLEQMSETSQSLSQISIFSDQNSFSYKNIVRTKQDFEALQGVTVENINDKAITAFLEYRELSLIGFLIVLVTVLAFFDERKSGLWQLVYTCRNGRLSLMIKRLIILFAVSLVASILLIVSTLAISFYDYGSLEILHSSAQSVTALQNFTVPISVLSFLTYYLLICTVALFVEGVFVWGVLSIIHNRNLGIIITAVIYGSEYFIYQILSDQNPLCILKYFNIYFLISPMEMFTDYVNFPLGNMLLNQREFVQTCLVALVVLLSMWVILVNINTHPFYVPGILERKAESLFCLCRRFLSKMNGIGYELYKFLILGKGIVVLAIFGYIMILGTAENEILMSPGRELLNDFYAENTGEINKATMSVYDEIYQELNEVEAELEAANTRKDNKFDKEILREAQNRYNSYNATRSMFKELEKQRSYGEKLQKRGIKGWFINERGFNKLLGDDYTVKRLLRGMLAVIALILILSPAFSSEQQSGIANIIRCTGKGRGQVFVRKYICAVCFILVIAGITFGVEVYEIMLNYPFDGLSAPVQNIRILERFPFHWNIALFLTAWFALRLLVMITISILCLFISSLTKRVEKTYLFSLLLLPMGLLSGVSEYMILGTGRILKTMLIISIMIVCSVTGFVLTHRSWMIGKGKEERYASN